MLNKVFNLLVLVKKVVKVIYTLVKIVYKLVKVNLSTFSIEYQSNLKLLKKYQKKAWLTNTRTGR